MDRNKYLRWLIQKRVGEEICSLSRFQVVQQTGFTKILKKYRRWTKDNELSRLFDEVISSRSDSLFQLDIGYLLEPYIYILGVLRSIFDVYSTIPTHTETDTQTSAERISQTLEKGDGLDFDLALTTVPLGSSGLRATYWVHSDNIVEVRVLLLQCMRLFTGSTRTSTRDSSSCATLGLRWPSATNVDNYLSNEDEVGLVVLDHAEAFAIKYSTSTIGLSEETKGNIGLKAAGNVRCVAGGKIAVVVHSGTDEHAQSPTAVKIAKLERKSLRSLMDAASHSFKPDGLERSSSHNAKLNESSNDGTWSVRQWLTEQKSAGPIAGAVSKRTRFIGIHNNSTGGIWATLDRDIHVKESLHKDLEADNWATTGRSQSIKFPHAVLEVRCEGYHAMSHIQALDRSLLVCKVLEFWTTRVLSSPGRTRSWLFIGSACCVDMLQV